MTDNGVTRIPREKQAFKLRDRDIGLEEFAYARMAVTLPVGISFEEILKPEFWANVAHKFRGDKLTGRRDLAGSILEIRTKDHAFYAQLYVRAVFAQGLVVDVLRQPTYLGPQEAGAERFDFRWNIGRRHFDIIRKSDGQIVGDAPTKEMAIDWVNETTANINTA